MKFLKPYLFAFVLVVSSPSYGYLTIGGGAHSCAYMLDNFSEEYRKIWRQWITGFISGLNYSEHDGKTGNGIDENALVYEVKNYCERNPMKAVVQATEFIYYTKLKKSQ